MKFALFAATVCLVLRFSQCNHADAFNELQTLLRARRDVLGESHYECYSNGECVTEYKMGELVTYREEPLCARSAEGCGVSRQQRKKREAACSQMSENFDQLCARSADADDSCSFMLEDMEEMECGDYKQEKVRVEKREECRAIQKRFEQQCKRGAGKRAISDECSFVLEDIESSDCSSDTMELQKRDTCVDGWTFHEGVCYKYFSDPKSWSKAEKECASQSDDESSHLATLERAKAHSPHDRVFFNDLIKGAGNLQLIDDVLSTMNSHYNGSDWKEMISYYDNWSWIGVRKIDDVYRWVSAKKENSDWNDLKSGQSDWYSEEPTKVDSTDIRMDHGNCVTYFQSNSLNIDHGAWWNVACMVELPFLCERDPQ